MHVLLAWLKALTDSAGSGAVGGSRLGWPQCHASRFTRTLRSPHARAKPSRARAHRRTSASRAWRASARKSTTCWSRPTWPGAASTCPTWRPSSTTTCRTRSRATRTASAAPAAPARRASPSRSSPWGCARSPACLQCESAVRAASPAGPGARLCRAEPGHRFGEQTLAR